MNICLMNESVRTAFRFSISFHTVLSTVAFCYIGDAEKFSYLDTLKSKIKIYN